MEPKLVPFTRSLFSSAAGTDGSKCDWGGAGQVAIQGTQRDKNHDDKHRLSREPVVSSVEMSSECQCIINL